LLVVRLQGRSADFQAFLTRGRWLSFFFIQSKFPGGRRRASDVSML
jgi:hypothetical protein